ncbi:MAG: alkaline phosphatase family protein, partial [Dehalococcoidia bacterium]
KLLRLVCEAASLEPRDLVPVRTIFRDGMASGVRTYALTREEFLGESFTDILYDGCEMIGYRDCPDMMSKLARVCAMDRRATIFAYWDSIDAACHVQGSLSRGFLSALAAFDRFFGEFVCSPGSDGVLLLLTADHGHLDCPPERAVELKGHEDLLAALSQPPMGEPRLPYLHVKAGKLRQVFDYLDDHFSDVSYWMSSEKAFKARIFGPSGNPRWVSRAGDIILLPKKGWCCTYPHLSGERTLLGRHGGASPQEMLIPLLWCRL